jgi:flagellar hook-associated protein 2
VDVAAESAKIGLSTTGTATTGVNVAGTINGIAATGNGQYLTAESGDPKDLKLLITGGVTGSRGSVSVGRGYADQLTVSLNNYIASNGLITGREKTLNDRINGYGDQEIKLDEKYDSLIVKYRKQFSMLNALLGEMETQRESMKATFEGMFGNN